MGLAYALASKVNDPVSRLPSSLAASVTDECVRIRSEVVDEQVNASRAVRLVLRPPDATGIAKCCVIAQNPIRTTLRETLCPKRQRTLDTACRLRSAFTSFPWQPPLESPHRGPARQPSSLAAHSLAPGPSVTWPSPTSCRHASAASDSSSVR